MAKNILFLVTGLTPQIVTETVWALACDPNNDEQWIPDEIHVMSTEDGLNQIRKRLFEDGVFAAFVRDYPHLANINFAASHRYLHSIKDDAQQKILDLKTPEDNAHAGDAICAKVYEFCSDAQTAVHVSIAGGRKTMGFYAGYALSLYGRAQDRMSHVLVEDKFESVKDFFYPTVNTHFVTNRDNKVLDAKNAQVWLAQVDFVRLQDAIKDKHQLKSTDTFSQVVSKINESFNDVKIKIEVHNKRVTINDKFEINDLSPREFAMLHWLAERRKAGLPGITAPTQKINSRDITPAELKKIQQLTNDYRTYYEEFKNETDLDLCVDKAFFESVKSRLHSLLESKLGLELAAKIAIIQERRGQPFYLNLPADAIEIVDTFSQKDFS